MKKHLTLLLLAAFMALSGVVGAQPAVVTVGTGTTSSNVAPFNNNYKNSYTQMVYSSQSLTDAGMTAGYIGAIAYDCAAVGALTLDEIAIYMGTTTSATIASTAVASLVPMANLTQVFHATNFAMPSQTGWFQIVLDTPYQYNPATDGNLAIVVCKKASSFVSGLTFKYTSASNTVAYSRSDTDTNYYHFPTSATTRATNLPNIQFTVNASSTFCFPPTGFAVSDVNSNSINVSWNANDAASYQVAIEEAANQFDPESASWNTTSATSYSFTNLNSNTAYKVYLRTDCSDGFSAPSMINVATTSIPATLPYFCDFEEFDVDNWTFVNGSVVNHWVIDTATHCGENSTQALYITNGTESHPNEYTINSACAVFAFRTLTIEQDGQYDIAFDWKANGEGSVDFLRAALVPASVELTAGTAAFTGLTATAIPAGWIPLDGNGKLNLVNNWQHRRLAAAVTAGTYNLVFYWRNDGSVGNMPPAAIDNVSIAASTCPGIDSVDWVTTETTATITAFYSGSPTEFMIVYQARDAQHPDTAYSYSGTFDLYDIAPSSYYDASIYTICGTDTTFANYDFNFRTDCGVISEFPWDYGFENATWFHYTSGSNTTMYWPYCWNAATGGGSTSYNWRQYTSTTYAHTGTSAAYMPSTTTASSQAALNEWLLTPTVTLTGNDQLSFWLRSYSTTTTNLYHVRLSVKVSDENDFTADSLYTKVPLSGGATCNGGYYTDLVGTTYTQYFADLSGFTGDRRIAFVVDTNSYTMYLDDLRLITLSNCPDALNPYVKGLSSTTATLAWGDTATNPTTTSWDIYIGQAGFSPDTVSPISVTDTFYTVEGLLPQTDYEFYVIAHCSDGSDANATLPVAFTTDCTPLDTLPIVMDFENVSTTSSASRTFIPCWGHLNNGTSPGFPYISSSSSYNHTPNGTKGLYWSYSTTASSYGDYQCVVLPGIDTDSHPINTLQLKFWAKASSSTYYPVLHVGVMSNYNDINSFQQVATINVGNNTEWNEFLVPLTDFEGIGNHVAIKAVLPTSSWTAYVDDITLEQSATCPEVIALNVTSTGVTSASIEWNTRGGLETPDSYEIELTEIDSLSSGTTSFYASDRSFMFTQLSAGTSYKVRVRASCSEYGAWDSVIFITNNMPCSNFDTSDTLDVQFSNSTTGISGCMANSTYGNTAYQTIYTAEELLAAGLQEGQIVAIDLGFNACTTYNKELSIYMTNSNVSSITSATMVAPTANDLVYSAVHPMGTSGWQHYELTTPFAWDGASNIMITTFMNQSGGNQNNSTGLNGYYVSAPNTAAYRYKDNVAFTIEDINTGTAGTSYGYRAAIHFYYNSCNGHLACAAPNVSIDSVDAYSVQLSWVQGYQETAWKVEYKQEPDSVWTVASDSTTVNSYTISGLTPSTTYQLRVGSICSDTVLYANSVISTPCAPTPIPYAEDFEGYIGGTSYSANGYPTCWDYTLTGSSTYQADSYKPYVYASSTYAHSGVNTLRIYGQGYFTLPLLDTSLNNLQLTFWNYTTSASYGLVVGVMEDDTFLPIDTLTTPSSTAVEHTVYFNRYHGNSRIIAFRNYYTTSASTYYSLNYIDDILVDYVPPCVPIRNLAASNVTSDSVTLTWDAGGVETHWAVSYPDFYTTTSTDSITLGGLTPDSTYTFSVQSLCGNDDSADAVTIEVHTACLPAALPYTENFDSYPGATAVASGVVPNCWSYTLTGSSTYATDSYKPFVYRSTTYANSGENCLRLYGVGYFCLPTMPVPLDSLQISFNEYTPSTSYGLELGVVENGNFVVLRDVTPTDISTHTYIEVPLSSYHGTSRTIAFRNYYTTSSTTYYSYHYLDDIYVDYIPTCPSPVNVAVIDSTCTSTSAEITWTDRASSPIAYELEYGEAGFTFGTGTRVISPVKPVVLTGLQPATSYDVYVRPICSDTDSGAWSQMFNFSTRCVAISQLPVFFNFENEATGTTAPLPLCWTRYNDATSTSTYNYYPYVYNSSTYAHSGSNCLYFYGYNSSSYADNMIASLPEIDVEVIPMNSLEVRFWGRGSATTSYQKRVIVGVMTDPALISTFVPVDTIDMTAVMAEYVVDLTNYTGLGTYVSFLAQKATSGSYNYVYLDDITLQQVADCPSVYDVVKTAVDTNMITLDWSDSSATSSWIVEYGPEGFVQGTGDSLVVTTKPIAINGLTTNTAYTFYITPACPGLVYPTAATFRTTAVVLQLPVNFTFDNTADNANWVLENGTNTNAWYIGSAAGMSSGCLYVSNDNGAHNAYTANAAGVSYAYVNLNLDQAGVYEYSFDWKAQGESTYDYIHVALVPVAEDLQALSGTVLPTGMSATTVPASWLSLHPDIKLNLDSTWSTITNAINIANPGVYHLAVVWRNDGSTANNPPAAIDNVSFAMSSCYPVSNLTVTNATADSIYFSWNPGATESSWKVVVASSDTTFTLFSTNTNMAIGGVTPYTDYTISVYAVCGGGDTSIVQSVSITTPCNPVAVPYTEDFDSYPGATAYASGVFPSCWSYKLTGSATYQTDTYKPFVYASSTYSHSGANTLRLYGTGYYLLPPMNVPLDSLQISFWNYTTAAAYQLEVGVMEGNTFIPIQNATPSATSTRESAVVYLSGYHGPSRVIAFHNFNSTPTTYYSYNYLDDIEVSYLPTCVPVYNVDAVAASISSIDVDWSDNCTAQEWQVRYAKVGTTASTTITTTVHPVTITGLDTLSQYNVEVRPICSAGDTADWSDAVVLLTSLCDNSELVSTGAATGTGNVLPVNNYYKYSLTETIIDSAELGGPKEFNAISYSYKYATASTLKTDVDIYIQPTSKSTFLSADDIVVLDTNIAVKVYSGSLNCTQGWNTFIFDTSYEYNGTGNLVIIVDDNSNGQNGSSYIFNNTSCTGNKSLAYYSDTQNPDAFNPSSFTATTKYVYSYRPTMQLISCGGACPAPVVTSVNQTYENIEMNWTVPGDSCEVAITDAAWNDNLPTTLVVGNTYTFTNLTPATTYNVGVRQLCEEGVYSDWTVVEVTTDSLPCFAPTAFAFVSATYHTATFSWTAGGEETHWNVRIFNTTYDSTYAATSANATFGGLQAGVAYNAQVRAMCGSNGQIEGDWCADTLSFTTADCAPVANLTATATGTDAIQLSWTNGGAEQAWVIEYADDPDFGQGEGTIVNVSSNPATVTGLEPNTEYFFYVYAQCEEALRSIASNRANATTHNVGINDVNGAANIAIYPNPATDMTTISVSGIEGDVNITIVDLNGRVVVSDVMECDGDCVKTMNVEGLAQGAYFVRIYGETVNSVKKLVVR